MTGNTKLCKGFTRVITMVYSSLCDFRIKIALVRQHWPFFSSKLLDDILTVTSSPTPCRPPSPLPSPRLLHPHSSPPPTTSRTGATIVCMLFWYFAPRLVSGSGDIKITKDGNVLLNEMVNYYLIIFNDDNYIYYFFNFIL